MNIADRLKIETHENFTLVIMDYDHLEGSSIIELQQLFLNHTYRSKTLEVVTFSSIDKALDYLRNG
jgi:hypothetical protein